VSFVYRGPLAPDSALFVGREGELGRIDGWLRGGDAVGLILGGRQNGKTTLMLRARQQLGQRYELLFVNLQGATGAGERECTRFIAERISDQLGRPCGADGADLLRILRSAAESTPTRLGLFIDEIGALPDGTARWLAGTVRSVFTDRFVVPVFQRLTFVLAGGEEMMHLAVRGNSPLRNVADSMYLGDLAPEHVAELLRAGGGPALAARAAEVHRATGGHPYFTQLVAEKLAAGGAVEDIVDEVVRVEDRNLPHIFHAVRDRGLERLVRRLAADERVAFSRSDDEVAVLELIGVVRDEAGACRGRCPIQLEAARRRYGIAAPAVKASRQRAFADGHALLVGVGDYLHDEYADLPATVRDVRALEQVLLDEARCGYPPRQVATLCGEQATLDGFEDGLAALARRSQEAGARSTVFVYFSGHGSRILVDGAWQAYLCPRGADPARLPATALSARRLGELLGRIEAGRMVVVFDACHAAAGAEFKGAGPRPGLDDEVYAPLARGHGRVVIASCRADQRSLVKGELSLFTHHLRDALRGKAAVRGDGLVRVLDVYHHVSEAVTSEAPAQWPVLKTPDLDLNFPLALAPAVAAEVAPATEIRELAARGRPGEAAEQLRRYLASRPEHAEARDEIDLLSSRLATLAHDEDLFGITPETRAEANRLTYGLLRMLARIG